MNEDLKGTIRVANELGLSVNRLRYKYAKAGINPVLINKKLYFTMEQIEQIKNFKKTRNDPKKHENYDAIIAYWRVNENNSSPYIARVFGVKEKHVNLILNTYIAGLKPKE